MFDEYQIRIIFKSDSRDCVYTFSLESGRKKIYDQLIGALEDLNLEAK